MCILTLVDFDRVDYDSGGFLIGRISIGWILTVVDFDWVDFERGWISIVYRKIHILNYNIQIKVNRKLVIFKT